MSDGSTITLVITGVSGAITAIIPLVAKFTAGKSEAVKAATMTRQADIDILKELLKRCTEEKLVLKDALLAKGNV